MALIDDRGRLFGRVNIIDAAVGVLLLGLIPLVYGAMVLFRQPEPTMLSITPAQLTPQVTRVEVTGRNFRPFLRVSFNEVQGRTFTLVDAQTAEVEVPPLPAGTYDVILYDVAREVSRLPRAVFVEGPALPPAIEARMLVTGKFVALDQATADGLQKGTRLGAGGGNRLEILDRGRPEPDRRWFTFTDHTIESPLKEGLQLPALLRVSCSLKDRKCQVGGIDIENGYTLPVFTESGKPLSFVVSDAAGDGQTELVNVRTRFVVPEQSAAIVRAGDRARRDALLGDRVPSLVLVGAAQRQSAAMSFRGPAGNPYAGEWSMELNDVGLVLDATVRLRADVTSEGLQYRGRPVRAGAPFVFDHSRYLLRGWVLAVSAATDDTNGRQ